MSEMIEQVERAIRTTWKKNVPGEEICRLAAIAAIAAMREPTGEQTDAAREASGDYPYQPGPGTKIGLMQAAILWRAMIDAALGQPK